MISVFQRLGGLSACLLLTSGAGYATIVVSPVTIEAFSATAATTGPYAGNEAIFSSYTANTARISANSSNSPSYVTCTTVGGCGGVAATFSLALSGYQASVPFVISIDGTLSPTTTVDGRVDLAVNSVPLSPLNFTVGSSPFETVIGVGSLPVNGNASITGDLYLTMADNQTITLPSSFRIDVNAPEPASLGTLALGLAAGALFFGRRRKKQ